MISSLPAGPHLPGEFARLCCRGMVFFVVVSGRGGGRVRGPIEVAFQGRLGHIFIYIYIYTFVCVLHVYIYI